MSDGLAPGTWVVWCDFGGVLTDPIDGVLDRFVRTVGVPRDALLAAFDEVAARRGMRGLEPLERGRLTVPEWADEVTETLAPDYAPRVDLRRFGELWYTDRTFNTALFGELVARISTSVRLGLLTNSIREWEPHRDRLTPDWTVFAAAIRSHEVGLRKPDKDIYRLAEQSLSVERHRCVLIDDTATNCTAARGCGWWAIHHQTNNRTLTELDRLLGTGSA